MQSTTVMTMFISTLKEYHYYVLTNILNQSLRAFFQIMHFVFDIKSSNIFAISLKIGEIMHFNLIEEKDWYQAIENTTDITLDEMNVDELLWSHLQSALIGIGWEIKFHQITNKNMFDVNNFKREAINSNLFDNRWDIRWFFGVDEFLFVLDSFSGMWCIDMLFGKMFKSKKIIPKYLKATQFVKTNDGYLHFISDQTQISHVRVLLLDLLPNELFRLYPLLIFGYIRWRVRLDQHFTNWVSKDMVNLIMMYSFKWNIVC